MKITGTFLDEISHDIPHQNWGEKEWDMDFAHMRSIGIDTVILIRCGYRHWLTYPSQVLAREERGIMPSVDLVRLFLKLAHQHELNFYFGIYDSGKYWTSGSYQQEVEINLKVIDEVWEFYGQEPAFKGWYLSQEVSRKTSGIIETYARLGRHCKAVSNNLPVLISPYIDGKKALLSLESNISKAEAVSLQEHEQEWDEIMAGIKGAVDIVAFQDGHVGFSELTAFLKINRKLAERHGLESWTNTETFDRDMPIKFLPIKWEKLRYKLEAAENAGVSKAITFEFSHFMSPQSAYLQAGHLFNRYKEHYGV